MPRRSRNRVVIAVCLAALVISALFYGLWSAVTMLFAPPEVTQQRQTALIIENGESTQEIADDLYKKGLIRNAQAFRLWARIKGLDTHLRAGAYSLAPG